MFLSNINLNKILPGSCYRGDERVLEYLLKQSSEEVQESIDKIMKDKTVKKKADKKQILSKIN